MKGRHRRFRDNRADERRPERRDDKKKKEFGAYRPERVSSDRRVQDHRLRWTAPVLNTELMPVPICAFCGGAIDDLHAAMTDKQTGETVHFDCVLKKLSETEYLESGETVSYIGGGRFGVVRINGDRPGNFSIKKIIEWENRENRASWRGFIADHYSIT
ncbi:MAG: hypothetical protein LBJ31_03670 [Treponema sp.]|jgi:hypothetical protein|nr:hypothetical protein [Treponema sp.]